MKRLVTIAPSLKFLFESIESILHIEIKEGILSKILSDCEHDQVNEKSYLLSSLKDKIKISALAEEYEPENICLIFEHVTPKQKIIQLEELFENYEFAFGTGANFRSQEESLAIFQRGVQSK